MNKKTSWIIKIGVVVGMYLTGIFLLSSLPDMLPIHWNAQGIADGFQAKNSAVWTLPSIVVGLLVLFAILPNIDPKKDKYRLFAKTWETMQVLMVLFFAYIYGVSLYTALHPEISPTVFILSGIGLLFMVLGNYMSKIKQNFFIGIKTPWTLTDEEVWNKTHRLGGWCFVTAGIIFLIEAWLKIFLVPVFVGAILLAAVVPIVYSYILHRERTRP